MSQECMCIFKLYQKNHSGLLLQTDFSGNRFCTAYSVIQQLLISAWLFYLFIFLHGILRKPVKRISDQKKKKMVQKSSYQKHTCDLTMHWGQQGSLGGRLEVTLIGPRMCSELWPLSWECWLLNWAGLSTL